MYIKMNLLRGSSCKKKILSFITTLIESRRNVEFHEHPFYEIFFFLSGNVNYIIEGRTYQLRPGDILRTSSRDIHRPVITPGKPYERYVIWMEDDFFARFQDWGDDLFRLLQ